MGRKPCTPGVRVWVVRRGDRGRLVLRWKDPTTGQRREVGTESNNPKKAQREAQAKEDELQKQFFPSENLTWAQFTKRYEDDHLSTLSKGSLYKWRAVVHRVDMVIRERALGVLPIREITPDFVSAVERKLRQELGSEPSVASSMKTFRAALGWAAEEQMMRPMPPRQKRRREELRSREMRGRPITGEEFDRMLAAADVKLKVEHAWKWKELLRGLYLSGLRLSEAMALRWEHSNSHHPIGLESKKPKLFMASTQKNREDMTVAITPDFAAFLREIRRDWGFVFHPDGPQGRYQTTNRVGKVIASIGVAANVVTIPSTDPEEAQYATAHDLRRSFGQRWAPKVMPPILQHLMRHRSIETTLKYYAGSMADSAAREVLDAWNASVRDQDSCASSCATETKISSTP